MGLNFSAPGPGNVTLGGAGNVGIVNQIGPPGPPGPSGANGRDGGGGVSSLNGLSGVVNLATSGNALYIRPVGNDIYIDYTGVAGSTTGYVPQTTQINGYELTGNVTILSSDIPVNFLPGSHYSNLQQFINTMNSPGLIAGAFISDAGSGIAAISEGTGMLRIADDNVSSLSFINIPATGLSIPADVQQYYIGFVYNGGSPIFELRAVDDWDNDTEIALGTVVNYFGSLVITNNPFLVGDPITNIIQRFDAMAPITRDAAVGGLILGEVGARYVTLSAGRLWTRLNDYHVAARDTSNGDIMYGAYFDGAGWNYQTPLTQWPNAQYNDPLLGLVALPDGYYANLWFYCGVEDGALGFIYGQAPWGNLTDAAAEQAPSLLPPNYTTTNMLVARLTFFKNAATSSLISSAFSNVFTTAPATIHDNLGGLQGGRVNEYYHLTLQDYSSLTGIADRLALQSYLSLSSVVSGASLNIGRGGALGVSAFTGVSGINGLTGATYIAGAQGILITPSGSTIFVSGQDWATNDNLTQTGVTLQGRIDSLSGFTTTMSGALQTQIVGAAGTPVRVSGSSVLTSANLTGVGGVTVTLSGTNVYVSGEVTKVQLDSLSGYSASSLNLTQTGQSLYQTMTGLSGQANLNYATASNLTLTGQTSRALTLGGDTNLSGNLTITGQTLYQLITGLSGQSAAGYATISNLALTGSNLYAILTGASGQGVIDYATKSQLTQSGQTLLGFTIGGDTNLSGNLAQSGVTLRALTIGGDTNLSGNLAQTGSSLYATLTGLSGQSVAAYATAANLTLSGQTLIGAINGGDTNLSGNLTITGQTLQGRITSLSGYVGNVSGALQAQIAGANGTQVKVSGSSTLTTADFTGQGTVSIVSIGGQVFISGAAGGGGGVTQGQLDSLSGYSASALNLAATGSSLYTILTGLSGQSVIDYATKTNLTLTGQTLGTSITAGDTALSGNLTLTGQTLRALTLGGDANLSGNLMTTGSTLYQMLTGTSGQANVNYATVTNLASTGQQAYLAGVGANATLSGNMTLTGQALGASVTAGDTTLSGNLTQTGVTLRALILGGDTNMSGNMTLTGQSLYNLVTGLSGQSNTNYATAANLTLSGQSLQNIAFGGDANLSGNLTQTGVTLIGKITSLSGFTIGVSGALQTLIAGGGSVVKVTGSNSLPTANLTGLGTVSVSYDGAYVLVSGSASAGGGVPSVNGIASAVTIAGTGGLSVFNVGSTIYVSGFSGVLDQQIPFTSGSSIDGDSRLMWDYTTGTLEIGSPLINYPDNPLSLGGSGLYVQANITNQATGASASSDWVATNDVGNNLSGYIDFGINSSNYSDPNYSVSTSGDGYMYVNGGNLAIGTQTPGKNLLLHVGGTASGNLVATVGTTGISLPSGKNLALGAGALYTTGISNKPTLTYFETGWGTTFMGPALWNKQFLLILPAATTSQTILGDTAANVGTLSTIQTEVLGGMTTVAPAAGLSAGLSNTTADVYRGSVTGRNGFFFVSKFALLSDWSSGLNTSVYGNPSGSRVFVGLSTQAVATQVGLNEPIGDYIGLTYLWASGGAVGTGQYMQNWAIRSRDNVATSTGTTPMVFQTGFYRYTMYCKPYPDNNTVWWQLDDMIRGSGCAGTITANLPRGNQPMRAIDAVGFVSGLKNISVANIYVETPGSPTD